MGLHQIAGIVLWDLHITEKVKISYYFFHNYFSFEEKCANTMMEISPQFNGKSFMVLIIKFLCNFSPYP